MKVEELTADSQIFNLFGWRIVLSCWPMDDQQTFGRRLGELCPKGLKKDWGPSDWPKELEELFISLAEKNGATLVRVD